MEALFGLIVLIFSVVIHEVSHGFAAERLGDNTARLAGRLTLNPLKHLDPIGSFAVPLISYFLGGFIFGWAKPVPYDPRALKNPKRGAGEIALAGPLANLLVALVFGFLVRSFGLINWGSLESIEPLFRLIVLTNIVLAVFNLVPLPPLDGAKVLWALLPETDTTRRFFFWLERYGLYLVLFFIFFGFSFIIPVVETIYSVFAG